VTASPPRGFVGGLWERDTFSDNWFGLGRQLEEQALKATLDFMQVYQVPVSGGGDTHMHSGRWVGRYNLAMSYDLSRHLRIAGGSLHAIAVGTWSHGLNRDAVRSLTDVNGMANAFRTGDEWILIEQYYYQQMLFDQAVMIRIGKIGLGDFDRNAYAEDTLTQFLNASLGSNATIPWPEAGLGIMGDFWFSKEMYVAAAVVDAEADRREMGFDTAFHHNTGCFSIAEFGWLPIFQGPNGALPGGYRVGVWWDCQRKVQQDINVAEYKRCDWGLYLGGHQLVWKENAREGDVQGLGVFFRYGYRPEHVSLFEHAWSVGCQYEGPIPTRDKDVLGFGVAQLILPDRVGFGEPSETAYEIYYTAHLTPWLSVGTSVQYVTELAGDNVTVEDAFVLAFRMHMRF
jgi:porin